LKKIRIIALLLAVPFAVCSCGNSESNKQSNTTAGSIIEETELTEETTALITAATEKSTEDKSVSASKICSLRFTAPNGWTFMDEPEQDKVFYDMKCSDADSNTVSVMRVGAEFYSTKNIEGFLDNLKSKSGNLNGLLCKSFDEGEVMIAGEIYAKLEYAFQIIEGYNIKNMFFVRPIDDNIICISATDMTGDYNASDFIAMFS